MLSECYCMQQPDQEGLINRSTRWGFGERGLQQVATRSFSTPCTNPLTRAPHTPPLFSPRCYARLPAKATNCRKKKCGRTSELRIKKKCVRPLSGRRGETPPRAACSHTRNTHYALASPLARHRLK